MLVLEDGRYIMQLRDPLPHIFYPDHWSCFGGAVDAGESPLQALQRELHEELELAIDPAQARLFTTFQYDLAALRRRPIRRVYYEIAVGRDAYARTVLHEGAEVRAFAADELLQQPRVTPYDSFVLWLHSRQNRLK